ncbi:DUF4422 domain-containing protein [Sunxiuqinia sp. A32]|uniref:DUF4422 domain-containing protein n=1 Tax=Sunxiuqinia sp. A32 TaxID=3461496 RepID=UPI0040455269
MVNTKILIATHKEGNFPENEIFLPIHVGKKRSNKDFGLQGDEVGDNISEKNPNYCELTAFYWAWKNLDTNIIGMYHYRRHFNLKSNTFFAKTVKFIKESDLDDYIPSEDVINGHLKKHDIILAKSHVYPYSMYVYYTSNHIREDIEIISEVLGNKFPAYLSTWNKFLYDTNKFSPYNMLICKKEVFDQYCEWLFAVLFEVEKKVKISPYSYQSRVFGFMAERLLNVYCIHNRLKIKHNPILLIEDSQVVDSSKIRRLFERFGSFLSSRLVNISFYIGNHKRFFKL